MNITDDYLQIMSADMDMEDSNLYTDDIEMCNNSDDYVDDYEYENECLVYTNKSKPKNNDKYTVPSDDDYNKQLQIGILVEMEHVHWWTDDDVNISNDIIEQLATNIATDHLKVNPKYYTALIKAGLVDEKDAIELHDTMYGGCSDMNNRETSKKIPLPIVNKSNRTYSEIGNDYRANITIEPITSTSDIQPTGISTKKPFTDYEDMINDSNNAFVVDDGMNVNFDEIDDVI
jgi:hypothetical protein